MCAAHGAPERFRKSGFAGAPRETGAARPELPKTRAKPHGGPAGCVPRRAALRPRYTGFDKPPWDQSPAERSTPRVSPSGAVSHLWDDASDALLAYSGVARTASREAAAPGSRAHRSAARLALRALRASGL